MNSIFIIIYLFIGFGFIFILATVTYRFYIDKYLLSDLNNIQISQKSYLKHRLQIVEWSVVVMNIW